MRSPNADCNKIEMVNYTDLIIFAGKRVILDNFSFLKKVARVMENNGDGLKTTLRIKSMLKLPAFPRPNPLPSRDS